MELSVLHTRMCCILRRIQYIILSCLRYLYVCSHTKCGVFCCRTFPEMEIKKSQSILILVTFAPGLLAAVFYGVTSGSMSFINKVWEFLSELS